MSTSSPSSCGSTNRRLTDHDRQVIADARALAQLRTNTAIIGRFPGWQLPTAAYAEAFGVSRHIMEELADIAERLGGKVAAPANFPSERPRPSPPAGGVHCFRPGSRGHA